MEKARLGSFYYLSGLFLFVQFLTVLKNICKCPRVERFLVGFHRFLLCCSFALSLS